MLTLAGFSQADRRHRQSGSSEAYPGAFTLNQAQTEIGREQSRGRLYIECGIL